MIRHNAYCPQCQSMSSMSVSIGFKDVIGKKGIAEKTRMMIYRCESCTTFVRSMRIGGQERVGVIDFGGSFSRL